jgi:hypothetical protein
MHVDVCAASMSVSFVTHPVAGSTGDAGSASLHGNAAWSSDGLHVDADMDFLKSRQDVHQADIYNFDTALSHLQRLSTTLAPGEATKVSTATATSTDTVGVALKLMLPNVISKPLAIDGSVAEREAQLAQVEQALRVAIDSSPTHSHNTKASAKTHLLEEGLPPRP